MIRITGGRLRGRKLNVPRRGVRPTTNRVRESIFSVIGEEIEGSSVLDLFAGTGVLGLEALSRGAANVVFVERNAVICTLLQQNITKCGVREFAEVLPTDWAYSLKLFVKKESRFDIAFADPPYKFSLGGEILSRLHCVMASGGLVVIEQPSREYIEFDNIKWNLMRVKVFGDTTVHFFRRV